MDVWIKEATKLQQEFCEALEDRRWDHFEFYQGWALESKVAFALFREPEEVKNLSAVSSETQTSTYYRRCLESGYTEKQKEEIRRICNIIYVTTQSRDVLVAFLFVVGKCDHGTFVQAIFRVMRPPCGNVYFIDSTGRVYKNWGDYKKNNKLPAGVALYPASGIYDSDENGEVFLEFAKTPAKSNKLVSFCDKVSGGTSVLLTGLGVFSLFIPVVGTVASVSAVASTICGIYGIGKGSSTLYDRSKHHQSISPLNSEAFCCWLSVAGNAFGMGSTFSRNVMVEAVKKGETIGKFSKGCVNFLNYGSLTVNGVGLAYDIGILIDKADKGELKKKDILKFTTSALFFGNSAVNAQTASKIIEQVQKDTISSFTSDLSKKRQKAFTKLVKKSGGDGTMEDRSRIIKGIVSAGSKDEFFRKAIRGQKQSSSTMLDDKGNLMVGGKAYVDSDVKLQTHVRMDPSASSSKPSANGSFQQNVKYLTVEVSMMVIETICKEHRKEFITLVNNIKIYMRDLYKYFAALFKRYFSSKGKCTVPSNEIINLINIAEKFAQLNGCKTKEDFMDFTRFLVIYQKSKLKTMESKYQEKKNKKKEIMGDAFDETAFALKEGVEDVNERESSFLKIINDEIKESMNDLKQKFEEIMREISVINEDGGLKFLSNNKAANEYFHNFVIDGEEISTSDFFKLIRGVVLDKNSIKTPTNYTAINKYHNDVVSVNVVEHNEQKLLLAVRFL